MSRISRRLMLSGSSAFVAGAAVATIPTAARAAGDDVALQAQLRTDPARPSDLGQVELSWPESDLPGARWYSVQRADGAVSTVPTDRQHRIATVGVYDRGELAADPETTTPDEPRFGDFATDANSTYTYRVVVRDGEGVLLATSPSVTITTGARASGVEEHPALYAWTDADARTRHIRWYDGGSRVEVSGGTGRPRLGYPESFGSFSPAGHGGFELAPTESGRTRAVQLRTQDQLLSATVLPAAGAHPRLMIDSSVVPRLRAQVAVPGSTSQRVHSLMRGDLDLTVAQWVPIGALRVNATKASRAALLALIDQDSALAERAYEFFLAAARQLYFGDADHPLFLGAVSSRLALTYDWMRGMWSDAQQLTARQVLNRIAAMWTATPFNNDFLDNKGSNWVGICRSGELLVRLSLLGTEEYVDDTARMTLVLDHLRRHLRDGYGEAGHSDEGINYWIYPKREVVPAILTLRSIANTTLEAEVADHRFSDLVRHTLSHTDRGYRVQFGVDTGWGSGQMYSAEYAAQGLALAPSAARGEARWHFDHSTGAAAPNPDFGSQNGRELALITYPEDVEPTAPAADTPALLDPHAGAFFHRSRWADGDDVLIGHFGANGASAGWQGMDTLALSIVGFGRLWTRTPEKLYRGTVEARTLAAALFSKPLVDGLAEPQVGRTLTVAAEPDATGGSRVSIDASGNYGITTARRDIVVDMSGHGQVSALIALRDQFSDVDPHTWTWQLSLDPEATVTVSDQGESGLLTAICRLDSAWLKVWAAPGPADTLTVTTSTVGAVTAKTLRLTSSGTDSDVKVVIATGRGAEPVATADGDNVTVAGRTFDLTDPQ